MILIIFNHGAIGFIYIEFSYKKNVPIMERFFNNYRFLKQLIQIKNDLHS
jgi:hypothetical protein